MATASLLAATVGVTGVAGNGRTPNDAASKSSFVLANAQMDRLWEAERVEIGFERGANCNDSVTSLILSRMDFVLTFTYYTEPPVPGYGPVKVRRGESRVVPGLARQKF